jgi:serine/threonine-protein kinase
MCPQSADRNLLFGIIALQLEFITRDQLIAAMNAWVLDKHRSIGQILSQQGFLASEDHQAIESLVQRHLLRHDNNPERSLASLNSIGPRLHDDLSRFADPEVQASLTRVGASRADSESTVSYVGSPTTPGGRFRILRPHAQGGLGVVSVALDEELHREVALKEIQERHASEEQPRLRFLLEAEITGGLEHPGIVPVYGLGHHPDGRPFYAMRFVRGESLKEATARFHGEPGRVSAGSPINRGANATPLAQAAGGEPGCLSAGSVEKTRGANATPLANNAAPPANDAAPLAFRRLLARFLDVCNAIAYAHSRGVLHRDIKPGNILLGPYGETLVVDWGLAKIVGRDEPGAGGPGDEPTLCPPSASGSGETVPGTALGTPAYMSPEQAEGRLDLLGPASDVYSLGATLYAVLTGQAPFTGDDPAEVLRKVQRSDFASPRLVNPSIPKPLEAICLKAMALTQKDRYASPRALAEDIEHWLADEPVSAYREPWPDRARRWSRRHRTLVTSAAAVLALGLLGSVGFAAVVTGKNRELARQTQRTLVRERMAVDAAKRFRDVVVEEPVLKNNPALEELRKKLLKEPLAFFQSVRAQLQADNETRPEALARLAEVAHDYAHLTQEIGDIQDGLHSHVESLAILEKLVRANPAKTEYWQGLAAIENCRGVMLSRTGHPDQAFQAYGEALAIRERLARENASVTAFQSDLATSHNNIGVLQSETGDPEQALESYAKAVAIQARLARENPNVTQFQSELAGSHYNSGKLLGLTGYPEQALASYAKAVAIQERLARENPIVTQFQSEMARSYNNIGILKRAMGHPGQALESFAKALAIRERLARENPSVIPIQSELAGSHHDIGNFQGNMGNRDQALESYAKAVAIQERLARENPSVTQIQSNLAKSHNNIGNLQCDTDHPKLALESYCKALVIQERLARENPSVTEFQGDLAKSHNNIALLQRDTGHPDQALESCGKARAIFERLASEHPETLDYASDLGATLNNMAMIDLAAKRFAQARDRLRQAISWQEKALAASPRHQTYRQFLRNHLAGLSTAAAALGNNDEARAAQRDLKKLEGTDPATVELDARLVAVIRGEDTKDTRERLQLAYRAYEKKLFAVSTRLYDEALKADPKLAEDRQAQHRYNAACTAALAARVKTTPTLPSPIKGEEKQTKSSPRVGEDTGRAADAQLTDAERAKLRSQARTWLEAELATWEKLLESAKDQQRQSIAKTLEHWRQDTDLSSIRDEAALAKLPDDERNAWKSLWANVDALLPKARKP